METNIIIDESNAALSRLATCTLTQRLNVSMYASCIELDPETMARYQLETGFYGELYVYDYMCKNRPELAELIRARNPHNR